LFNNTPHRMVGILGTKFSMVVNWAATSINLGYIGEQSSSLVIHMEVI
jgi:hypothetical protein